MGDGRHVVRVAALLGAAGVLGAAGAIGAAIGSLHHVPMTARHLEVLSLRFSYPSFNAAEWLILGVAVLGAAAATVAVRAAWRQRVAYRGFLDQLKVVRRLDGYPSVKVIEDPRPQAFCAGYLRPTVYVSQRALDLLTEPELQSVLAHEHHHKQVRDPLRFACGRVLGQALFFVPVLRSLCDRYSDLAELSADDAAIRACAGGRTALASALLQFDASAPPGVSGVSPERVDSLLGHAPRWRPSWWLLAASIGSLLILLLLIWRASEVASAQATFNLPFLSSQPCLVMSLLLPVGGCEVIVRRRGGAGRH
jgi:Zn-dependent protease with chaperone function